jgi:serine/threonine protein kinase
MNPTRKNTSTFMVVCTHCRGKNQVGHERCSGCGKELTAPRSLDLESDPKQLVGRIVNGKYQVLSILGEGGMGVVYRVRHLILQNKNNFAMKILHPKFSARGNFRSRFLREVEVAMELTHENIIQIRDFGATEQGLLFYTMDFFPGENLSCRIQREGRLPADAALAITRQVLHALAEAHKAGIVHRDLKPDNILVERSAGGVDRVRVLDFGIAKILAGGPEDEDLTGSSVLGTPKYMSPEHASAQAVDGRSDLYSLGCIMYEMLSGKPPFTEGGPRTILLSHLTVPPRPFKELVPPLEAPSPLGPIVFRLLEKEKEKRPASAAEVFQILDGIREAPVEAPARRRRGRVLVVAAAALLAAAGAFFLPVPWLRGPGLKDAEAGAGASAGRPEAAPEVSPEGSPSTGGSGEQAARLHCGVCGASYLPGERVGDMCHGEPLIPD